MKPRTLLVLTLLVTLTAAATAQRTGSDVRVPVTRESMLVSTEWLTRHLTDSDIVILHLGGARADYEKAHIPGARFLALSDIVITRDGVPNELPPVADLKKAFESAGVSDSSRVILYGDRSGLFAARAFFTIDYMGHGDRAALLDGGLEKWRADQRPISTEAPQIQPGRFTPHVHPEVLVPFAAMRDLSWEATNSPRPSIALLDARPPEEFAGSRPNPSLPRAGHIPGAVSLYWMNTLDSNDDPELLPPADLRKLFAKAGIAPGRKVVTYCVTGMQASFAYFVARYLGYEAAMYDGSLIEWNKSPDAPLVTSIK